MNSEDKANNISDSANSEDEIQGNDSEETRKMDIESILEEFKKERDSAAQEDEQPDVIEDDKYDGNPADDTDKEDSNQELPDDTAEDAESDEKPEESDVNVTDSENGEEQEPRDEEYEKYYNKYYKRGTVLDRLWRDRSNKTRVFIIILIVIIILITCGIIYIDAKLDLIDFDKSGDNEETSSLNEQNIYDDEDYEMMSAIEDASSLKDYLYKWANNGGEKMASKNVINVLLLGLDSKDALENGGRSDVIMLLSLNKKTKKINISSIYRDTWLYMNVDGQDRYTKFNASYFYGGPEGTIKTFEDNLKIKIDFYVAVDFSSFTDIINALGGITLEVQEYEAKYINRTTVHTIDYGPAVKLDGWEALVFARIRHSDADSDVSRTRRQRQVITALLNELQDASFSQMNGAINALFKYVKTNLSRTKIVSYATQAMAYRWMDYGVTQTILSDSEVFGTGWVGDASTVFVDMPLAAYRLQTDVFGESNIVLDANRVTIFDLTSSSSSSSSSDRSSSSSGTTGSTSSYNYTTTQTTRDYDEPNSEDESEKTTQSAANELSSTQQQTTIPTTEHTTQPTTATTQAPTTQPTTPPTETQPSTQEKPTTPTENTPEQDALPVQE